MKMRSKDTFRGLIVFSPNAGQRQSALISCGRTLLSPNAKKEDIRIRITSRHTALPMHRQLRRVKGKLTLHQEKFFPQNTIPYRAFRWNENAFSLDWDGCMTFRPSKISRVLVDMRRNISSKKLSLALSGLKDGRGFVIRKTGLSYQKLRAMRLSS